jgi:hypothetical protein
VKKDEQYRTGDQKEKQGLMTLKISVYRGVHPSLLALQAQAVRGPDTPARKKRGKRLFAEIQEREY